METALNKKAPADAILLLGTKVLWVIYNIISVKISANVPCTSIFVTVSEILMGLELFVFNTTQHFSELTGKQAEPSESKSAPDSFHSSSDEALTLPAWQ